jgi:electron transport complex protein RnfD
VARIYTWQLVWLLPAAIGGVWVWGLGGLRTLLLAVGFAVACEALVARLRRRPGFLADGSVLVQGLLLGMLLHAETPWWLVLVAAGVMVFLGKHFFGGQGSYPFNPPLLSYAIMLVSWPGQLNGARQLVDYTLPFPAVAPLEVWRSFGAQAADVFPLGGLLWGQQVGGVGSTMIVLLLVGGVVLMAGGYLPWRTPLAFLAALAITAGVFHLAAPADYPSPWFHLCAGLAVFAALFLASDFTSSPVNPWAQVAFGAGCGILTVLIRTFGAWPDGAVFAVLLMNIAHPLVDKIRPQPLAVEVPAR